MRILLLANQRPYQVGLAHKLAHVCGLVGIVALQGFSRVEPAGLEPATSCLQSSLVGVGEEAETPEIAGENAGSTDAAD